MNFKPQAPNNPYRDDLIWSHSPLSSGDPWAADREKAPGFRVTDIDYLLRQAFAAGRQDAFGEAKHRHADIYDEGYLRGQREGRAAVVAALGNYETDAIFNGILESLDRTGVPKTTIKAEREAMRQVSDRVCKVADRLDAVRQEYGK